MRGFERRLGSTSLNMNYDTTVQALQLDERWQKRNSELRTFWNFYKGFHWEDIGETDGSEITENYCRVFVDKFVAFELGDSFTFAVHESMSDQEGEDSDKGEPKKGPTITSDGRTSFEFLEDVWEDNSQYMFCLEMGIMKSVTGEAWVHVHYQDPEDDDFYDPYGIYDQGRIRLLLLPTSVIYPVFSPKDRERLESLTVAYQYQKTEVKGVLRRSKLVTHTYKQTWTDETITVEDSGADEPYQTYENELGTIPFIQIKNLVNPGETTGRSDLEDLIPINTELNLKISNVSEILDYHAAPVTVVFGAKIGNLEKGANKMWGGLPKDAKVENLGLNSDLGASNTHIANLKTAMCEVAGVPESALGGKQGISNTSGVAMQYANMPLIDKTKAKRVATEDGLERLNRLILLVAEKNGLVTVPENISRRDFFYNTVSLPDTLPKDTLMEIQQIQAEMNLALEDRTGALTRLKRENPKKKLARIDAERAAHPELYANMKQGEKEPKINSGMTNGQTPIEEVRKEMTGQNGGTG